jgi:hypothetical protein
MWWLIILGVVNINIIDVLDQFLSKIENQLKE